MVRLSWRTRGTERFVVFRAFVVVSASKKHVRNVPLCLFVDFFSLAKRNVAGDLIDLKFYW